ncbi:hypothetical protein PFICI_05115 [Pestalotiopsis fici W106-1]|uniref:NACHT domain-containing protein n=1 Tax=Pestalotiopsis fici (strain W106-1 / CGMCC3.15140) TaxID=1229662 RepID=W3XB57_PESFW|nr:uncharacterized protein PFICI_05115 [Pestalotiopsis fici W106-1]ETS83239.1 hypothetical protein PFICI_05115 [Pestalotiopsis fici W106-1]
MADGLGIAASVIAVIELAAKVTLTCYQLKEKFKDFRKDIKAIIEEVETVSIIVEELNELTAEVSTESSSPNGKAAVKSTQFALDGCKTILQELNEKLGPLSKPRFRDKLKWPLDSSIVHAKLDDLQKHKATLQLALSLYQTNAFRAQATADKDRLIEEKRTKVLHWYGTSDPKQNQRVSSEARDPNTGAWVFAHEKFTQWKESLNGALLWLHGIPGAGKTILCSNIIEHMEIYCNDQSHAKSLPARAIYYYFDFKDSSKQNMQNLLKSCVFQLISTKPGISKAATDLFEDKHMGLNEPSLDELLQTLLEEALLYNTVFLMMDGLDECPEKQRKVFLDKILQPLIKSDIHLLLTSRKETDIEDGLAGSAEVIAIQDSVVDADIRTHVHNIIAHDKRLSAMPSSIQSEMLECIVSGAHGMFRWAECQLEAMKECLTATMVREKLRSMPKDLYETYDRILRSLKLDHRPFVQSALRWLAFSGRPLRLEELAEAATIRPESGRFDKTTSRFLTNRTIVELCGVLVSITTITAGTRDRRRWLNKRKKIAGLSEISIRGSLGTQKTKEVTIVSLSHASVKEYILSPKTGYDTILAQFHMSEKDCNSFIAQCCLLYLLNFNAGKIASSLDMGQNPLLEYSASYWMDHWEFAQEEHDEYPLKQLCGNFFSPDAQGAYINWMNIWDPDDQLRDERLTSSGPKIIQSADFFPQPLYWASTLGDFSSAKLMVQQGADPTTEEGYLASALGAATISGHVNVMHLFLQMGVGLTMQSRRFGSLLQTAVIGGSNRAVQLLIEAGADVNACGGKFITPLIAAVSKQRKDLVELLLENGARLDNDFQGHVSALSRAALDGNVTLVDTLISAGADVNASGCHAGARPLLSAVKSGSIETVGLLLSKGADVNMTGQIFGEGRLEYMYPLALAARGGSIQIVRRLLAAGANPNPQDHLAASTALKETVVKRNMACFEAILNAGADPNLCGHQNDVNCLSFAIINRQYHMAKDLIKAGAQWQDHLISTAVEIHNDEPWVLANLLERDEVGADNFCALDGSRNRPPIHSAISGRGNEETLRLLLKKGAYVDVVDCIGSLYEQRLMTPLCRTLYNGNMDLANILIDYGADVNRALTVSPLEMAIKSANDYGGSLEAFNMLLSLGADMGQLTEVALFWPLRAGNVEILRFLVEKGLDVNRLLNSPELRQRRPGLDHPQCTPVQLAAQLGHIKMIQVLLELGADINGVAGEFGTTLHYGLSSKNTEVVNLLFDRGARVANSISDRSLIYQAIKNGLASLVTRLIDAGADVNATDVDKSWKRKVERNSPLHLAFCRGDQVLVETLRQYGAQFQKTDTEAAIQATRNGRVNDLELMVEYGLNCSASDIILEASRQPETTAIALLVEHGADLSAKSAGRAFKEVCARGDLGMAGAFLRHGATPDKLANAAGTRNNVAMIDLLLSHGANIDANDGACFKAAGKAGCRKVLARLLKEPMTASDKSHYLGIALQGAVTKGNSYFAIWLLDVHNAPLNHVGSPYGSPLQAAFVSPGAAFVFSKAAKVHEHAQLIRTMLERGASVSPPLAPRSQEEAKREEVRERTSRDVPTVFNAPLLSLAMSSSSNRWDLRHLSYNILAHGADVNSLGGPYHTPLQTAAYCFPEILEVLLDAGAEVNATGGRFGTALHAAAWNHDVKSVKLLLERGADVRISAGKYGSALICSAHLSRFNLVQPIHEVMQILFEAGADIHCRDGKYGSAVQMAAKCGNVKALRWLADHGADIRVQGGRWGNAYKAAWGTALKRERHEARPCLMAFGWLEQNYGRDGWD